MKIENSSNQTVCAVVVTYNRQVLLQECIEALRNQSHPVNKILVINNGSTDGTKEWLDEQKDLWVIHQENLGGAGGFHRGVKEAQSAGYDWIWLMDDDVFPNITALQALMDASVELGQVGFLASRVVGNDNLPLNVPTLDNKPLQNGSPRWIEHAEMGLLTLKSATFVSLLIPITIVNQVGLPIAEMFIWGDDIEYTTRITCHKPAYLVLKSCVVHARANQKNLSIATETNPERVKMFRYHYRNTTYISLKYKDYKLFSYHVISSIAEIFKSIFKVHGIQKGKVIVSGLYNGLIMSYSKKY